MADSAGSTWERGNTAKTPSRDMQRSDPQVEHCHPGSSASNEQEGIMHTPETGGELLRPREAMQGARASV